MKGLRENLIKKGIIEENKFKIGDDVEPIKPYAEKVFSNSSQGKVVEIYKRGTSNMIRHKNETTKIEYTREEKYLTKINPSCACNSEKCCKTIQDSSHICVGDCKSV